jgi:hypothetical protein
MYSEGALEKIVSYYRQPVRPVPLQSADDVKAHPNDILMSYLIAAQKLDRRQIAEYLQDLDCLEVALRSCVPVPVSLDELPALSNFRHYLEGPMLIGMELEEQTGKFAAGDGGSMLVADKDERVHTYPSGKKVTYFELTNEYSANLRILDMGCVNRRSGHVYVRQNSVNMLLALMDVRSDEPQFARFAGQMNRFDEHLAGITIAHELGELAIIGSGSVSADNELESERFAREFLKDEGFDMGNYWLFHSLRAYVHCEEKGKDYSRMVLESSEDVDFFI